MDGMPESVTYVHVHVSICNITVYSVRMYMYIMHVHVPVAGYDYSSVLFRFTGNWCSMVNMMPLNAVTSKIFWKMLQGPEVLPKYFTFGFLYHDNKSNMFSKMLKKKNSEQVSRELVESSVRTPC